MRECVRPITHVRIFPSLDRCAITHFPGEKVTVTWHVLDHWVANEEEFGNWTTEVYDALASGLDETEMLIFDDHWKNHEAFFPERFS